MAIKLYKENSCFNIYHQCFLIESSDDLAIIESTYHCQQGDKALLPDGSFYIRHSDDYSGNLWELNEGGSEGGSDLPEVSAADNGDVLTVVNGTWAKAEAPTGLPVVSGVDNGKYLGVVNGEWSTTDGDVFSVTVTMTQYDYSTSTSMDKSMTEINNAINNGQLIGVNFRISYEYTGFTPSIVNKGFSLCDNNLQAQFAATLTYGETDNYYYLVTLSTYPSVSKVYTYIQLTYDSINDTLTTNNGTGLLGHPKLSDGTNLYEIISDTEALDIYVSQMYHTLVIKNRTTGAIYTSSSIYPSYAGSATFTRTGGASYIEHDYTVTYADSTTATLKNVEVG